MGTSLLYSVLSSGVQVITAPGTWMGNLLRVRAYLYLDLFRPASASTLMMSCVLFRDTTVSSIMCPTSKQPKVLLLEDAHWSASIIALLTGAEFEVIQTQDVAEAWAILDARDDVDVLLADIDIPSPTGGIDLGWYVQDRWPGLGLVLTSGQVRHLRPDEIPGDGCFLPHPIPADTLLDEIRLAAHRL